MSYITAADNLNLSASYTSKSLRTPYIYEDWKKTPGIFGTSPYTTDFLPMHWTRGFSNTANNQDLADFLLEQTIDADSRVTKVISDHFWEF